MASAPEAVDQAKSASRNASPAPPEGGVYAGPAEGPPPSPSVLQAASIAAAAAAISVISIRFIAPSRTEDLDEAKVRSRCKSTLESLLAPASLNGDKRRRRPVIHRVRGVSPSTCEETRFHE